MSAPAQLHCDHGQAPLKRIGKTRRRGRDVYVLLCTECGFAVTTDELRRRRRGAGAEKGPHRPTVVG